MGRAGLRNRVFPQEHKREVNVVDHRIDEAAPAVAEMVVIYRISVCLLALVRAKDNQSTNHPGLDLVIRLAIAVVEPPESHHQSRWIRFPFDMVHDARQFRHGGRDRLLAEYMQPAV